MNIILINTGPAGPPACAGFLLTQSVSKSLGTGEGDYRSRMPPSSFLQDLFPLISFCFFFFSISIIFMFFYCLFIPLSFFMFFILFLSYFLLIFLLHVRSILGSNLGPSNKFPELRSLFDFS